MRNLKRVLALAMAMVMILGMMVIGSSAASYSDEAAISAEYADSVEILSGMGVFKGTGAGFAPKQILTRAEAAALIYRVITGDTADKQVQNYDYASLKDVKAGAWYTGYVTYANNGGYIKGDDAGNFNPNAQVTGIQVMAIMLRAAGYGQNGEYEGAAWMDNILTDAKELGITGTISTATLNAPASRELVAQLIFNAITKVEMVSYAPLLGYTKVNVGTIWKPATQTLAQKVFNLDSKADHDRWGRPATIWFDAKKGSVKGVYATIEAIPEATYTTVVSECDIAADLGLKKDGTVVAETLNGDDTNLYYVGSAIEVKFAATKKVGAQGRLTEVYKNEDGDYEIVYIDQFLAKVTDVTEVEYDKNGHITADAKLYLTVYGEYDAPVVLTADENYEYEAGDMLLVYYDNLDVMYLGTQGDAEYVEIIGYADSMVGAQSAFTTDPVHIIDGTEYPDAVQFNIDETEKLKTVNYTWYFDTYGNLIGAFEIASTYNYGVISAIKWVEMDDLLEDGYALATITYIDGTSENAKIAEIDGEKLTMWNVEETKQENVATWVRKALYEISTSKKGLVLTKTTKVENAIIETGIPAMTATVNGGNKTMYLVWNAATKSYETYTGIKNIPTYEGTNTIWVKDVKGDKVVEYVFINAPTNAAAKKTVTYFWNGKLTVKTNLEDNAVVSYTVTGGYVNGAKDAITIKAGNENVLDYITSYAQKGNLLTLSTVNGYVAAADEVTTLPVEVKSLSSYAVYAGPVEGTILSQDVLVAADGTSYDVDGAAVITYKYGLAQTVKYDQSAYLYVIYTYGKYNNEKIASLVYITDAIGETYIPTPVTTYTVNGAGAYHYGDKVIVETLEGSWAKVESDKAATKWVEIENENAVITVTGNMTVTEGYYRYYVNDKVCYTTAGDKNVTDLTINDQTGITALTGTGCLWTFGAYTDEYVANTGAHLDIANNEDAEIKTGYVKVTIIDATGADLDEDNAAVAKVNSTYVLTNTGDNAVKVTVGTATPAVVNAGATYEIAIATSDVEVTVADPFVTP